MLDLMGWSQGSERVEVLRKWLSEEPFEWGPAIATRAAFRAIPWLYCQPNDAWLKNFGVQIFHALFIAWSTTSHPVKGHKHAADLSSNLLYPAAMHHASEAYFASGMRQIDYAIIAKAKIDKVDHSIRALVAFENLIKAKAKVVPVSEEFFWSSVQEDVRRISQFRDNKGAKKLLRLDFVPNEFKALWEKYTDGGMSAAVEGDASFSLWKNWLGDVVRFRRHNFFEGDGSADASVKDRQVTSRIIHTVDIEFWSRDASEINADIESWIASETKGLSVDETGLGQVPAQNSNAISFRANAGGKIELSELRHLDVPSSDQETLDRYDECISNAREIHARCQGSNSARRLVNLIERYLSAAGEEISDLRSSLFVQRGERIRQEIAAYMSHDNMLAPLADDILLDLKAWEASHNMFVGLDPALMARDTALAGPADRIADVPPREIRDVALDADKSGILAENVAEVIVEATTLAPEIPDPLNRRTIWSFETGRNLVIEAFNIALRHPAKCALGGGVAVTSVATLGPAGTVLSLAATSIPAGKFLLRHRKWIESKLGDSPTWRTLFLSLVEWLDENTPFSESDGNSTIGPKE